MYIIVLLSCDTLLVLNIFLMENESINKLLFETPSIFLLIKSIITKREKWIIIFNQNQCKKEK